MHLQCAKPSGKELRKFGVVGTVQSPTTSHREILVPKGDSALHIPVFSKNEVPFGQWLSAVEGAKLTSSPQALHS